MTTSNEGSLHLTERQSEILALVAKGFTNAEIGAILGVAAGTVKVHVSAIIDRLDVTNRTEAASVWLSHSLIPLMPDAVTSGNTSELVIYIAPAVKNADAVGYGDEVCEYIGNVLRNRGHKVLDQQTARVIEQTSMSSAQMREKFRIDHRVLVEIDTPENQIELTVTCSDPETTNSQFYGTYAREKIDLTMLAAEVGIDIHVALQPLDGLQSVENNDVTSLYWQGKYQFSKRTPDSLQKALSLFQAAIAQDQNYVPAHVGLSNTSHQLAVYAAGMSKYFFDSGKKAALHAVSLDPEFAPAHGALGYAQMFGEWDLPAAHLSLQRCVALDPEYDEGLVWQSLWHMFKGEHAQALEIANHALHLNPVSIPHFVHVGHVLRSQQNPSEAKTHLSVALEMEPENLRSLIWMSLCQVETECFDLAGLYISRALDRYPTAGVLLGISAYIAAGAGDMDGCRDHLSALKTLRGTPTHSPMFEAFAAIGMGEHDTAITLIRESFPQKVPMLLGWNCDPVFQHLRSHPEFNHIGIEIGLTAP